ncbi:MAG: sigma-54 dependent transcriptional regulator [Desulfobacteraceae bacterium]|nr:sigma-54 dependent transcriptional regulator [Desulfobacteraceae bacterium]
MKETAQNILVVDDDSAHRTMLRTLLREWGYQIQEVDDGSGAIEAVRNRAFDLILMDIRMVRVSGIEALDEIKAVNPAIPVVLMTAYSSVETAVEGLKKGAYDYLTKPLDFEKLKVTIRRAMEHLQLRKENRALRKALGLQFDPGKLIGRSPAMVRLMETVAQAAPSEATVLIRGESGTGKEMIAGAIHHNSHRREGPFVKINCAAITETLLESELFGHERGAYTGADRRREGRFVQADGGSLFLDEVSEMSVAMQAKLLRVLQEREVVRVGGEAVIAVDVRLIAATNRDLQERVQEGLFREDLYYRLNVVNLEVPPLRNRRQDIPLLADHFLRHFSEKNRKEVRGFTPEAVNLLTRHGWPGNVRELMNAVERAVVLCRSNFLGSADFADLAPPSDPAQTAQPTAEYGATLEDVERGVILQTLHETEGNKSEAARRLGITRKTLHTKLRKYEEEEDRTADTNN